MSNGVQRKNGESNGLGIAGFVVSLVGLLSCGLLSPIGLIMSLIALGREPKGLAIAGVVIGAVGSCGIISGVIFFPVAIAAILAAVGLGAAAAALGGPNIEAKVDIATLSAMVEHYSEEHGGQLPLTLAEATKPLGSDSPFLKDRWNHEYVYMPSPDGRNFVIFSKGEDGVPGTADDIYLDEKDKPAATAAPSTPTAPTTPDAGSGSSEGESQ